MEQIPLSPEEAERLIQFILKNGKVEVSFHCKQVSMPKRGVNYVDLVNVLRSGHIVQSPEWSDEHQNWKYRVEGLDTEGDDLTAITVVFELNLMLRVITVF